MKRQYKRPLNKLYILVILMLPFFGNTQPFWTEDFGTGCDQGQLANGFNSANGLWNVTQTGVNDPEANVWFVSATEAGMGTGNCGDGCLGTPALTDRTLHIGNEAIAAIGLAADNGAAYNAGGFCGSGICVITEKRAESPVINCTGESNITLSFEYIENGQGLSDNAEVWYFDGAAWAFLGDMNKTALCGGGQGEWDTYTVNLPASADNNPAVQVGFLWYNNDDGNGTDPSIAIDNIQLESISAAVPVADFFAGSTTICVGDCIDFTDISTNSPTSWFWNFNGADTPTSSDQNPTNICYSTPGLYTVSLEATNASGSDSEIKTDYIEVIDVGASISGNLNVCPGESTTLTANTASGGLATYSWNTGDNTQAITVSPAVTTTYTVDITQSGCTGQAQVTVNVGNILVEITGDDTICTGGSATLTATGGTSYTWQPGGQTGNSITVSPTTTTTYTVEGTQGTCTDTDVFEVVVVSPPTATANSNSPICEGEDIELTGGGGGTYSWTGPNGFTSTDQNPVITNATAADQGLYVLEVTSGCSANASVNVIVTPSPTITVDNQTDETCAGLANGTASVSATGGQTPYSFEWNDPDSTDGAVVGNLGPGTYTVTITDATGCVSTEDVTIAAGDTIFTTLGSSESLCASPSGDAWVSATGGDGNFSFIWNDGTSGDSLNDVTSSWYYVTVTDGNGCQTVDSVFVPFEPGPQAGVNATDTVIIQGEETTQLFGFGQGNYTWFPDSTLSCPDCPNPEAFPDTSTTYCLEVRDPNTECVDTACIFVRVDFPCAKIFVPNAFSPNQDGKNDLLCVFGECIVQFDFYIFNRWGEQVFRSQTQKFCWDGSHKGQPVNTGIYTYRLRVTLEDGSSEELSGNINLFR